MGDGGGSEEGDGGGFLDGGVDELAGEGGVAWEDDDLIAACAADELDVVGRQRRGGRFFRVGSRAGGGGVGMGVEVGVFGGAFDEYFDGLADEELVVLGRDFVLEVEQVDVS